jgi:hypothetical protein
MFKVISEDNGNAKISFSNKYTPAYDTYFATKANKYFKELFFDDSGDLHLSPQESVFGNAGPSCKIYMKPKAS